MLRYIETNLKDITAIEALDILINEFGMGYDVILFNGTRRVVTLESLQLEYESLKGILAKYVSPIEFWGGPGRVLDYYTGSLLTLLCDRILRAWGTNGSYADLVESFVEC